MAGVAGYDRGEPFGHLDAIIDGKAGDGQHLFDWRLVIACAAIDALETVIAAEHQQRAAIANIVAQQAKTVRRGLRMNPGIGMQEQRVGADIGENDRLVLGQRFDRLREIALRFMRRHEFHVEVAVLQRLQQFVGAGVVSDGRELIKTLDMGGGGNPRLAGEKNFVFGHENSLNTINAAIKPQRKIQISGCR